MKPIPLDQNIFEDDNKVSFPWDSERIKINATKKRQTRTLRNGNKLIVEIKPIIKLNQPKKD